MENKNQQINVEIKHCASCCSHLNQDGYCTNIKCKLKGKSQNKDQWAKEIMDDLMSNSLNHTDCEQCSCHQ